MNIFYLHSNPTECARYHNDKHVIKMILESAQMLSTACWETGGEAPYKSTHVNHPSNKWVRESIFNWLWLRDLALALEKENQMRQGHLKSHKSADVIRGLTAPNLPTVPFTPPPQCMPDDSKDPDTVQAYRKYYMKHKREINTWKNRPVPDWYV